MPKTSTERVRAFRQRKCQNKPPRNPPKREPKSAAQRVREFRERQKALKIAAATELPLSTSQVLMDDNLQSTPELSASYNNASTGKIDNHDIMSTSYQSEMKLKSTECVKAFRQRKCPQNPPKREPKSGTQRARECRERQKALKIAAVAGVPLPTSQVLMDDNLQSTLELSAGNDNASSGKILSSFDNHDIMGKPNQGGMTLKRQAVFCFYDYNGLKLVMPKTISTECIRNFRQRKHVENLPKREPKSGTQRSRECRERQKALKIAAATEVLLPTSQVLMGDNLQCASELSASNNNAPSEKMLISSDNHDIMGISYQSDVTLKSNKFVARTSTHRVRAYRERQKLLQSESSGDNKRSVTKVVKTSAERGREYRERQKLLETTNSSTGNQQSITSQIKTPAQRSREYRERRKRQVDKAVTDSKKSTERVKAFRQRKRAQNPPKRKPKSGTQRARECRERQKALKIAVAAGMLPTSQVGNSIDNLQSTPELSAGNNYALSGKILISPDNHDIMATSHQSEMTLKRTKQEGGVDEGDISDIKKEPEYIEVDVGPTTFQHMDSYYSINQQNTRTVKQEGIMNDDNVDSPLCREVKRELIEIELTDVDAQKCNPDMSPAASPYRVSTDQYGCIKVEAEETDLDIGPTLFQPMDSYYTINEHKTCVIKQENMIDDGANDSTSCDRVKMEHVEDKLCDSSHSAL